MNKSADVLLSGSLKSRNHEKRIKRFLLIHFSRQSLKVDFFSDNTDYNNILTFLTFLYQFALHKTGVNSLLHSHIMFVRKQPVLAFTCIKHIFTSHQI